MNDVKANSSEQYKNAQKFLEFSSFADSLNDGLYVTDPDGLFIYGGPERLRGICIDKK